MSLAKCRPMTDRIGGGDPAGDSCWLCGEARIEVVDVRLCPECDKATVTQIRSKAF